MAKTWWGFLVAFGRVPGVFIIVGGICLLPLNAAESSASPVPGYSRQLALFRCSYYNNICVVRVVILSLFVLF